MYLEITFAALLVLFTALLWKRCQRLSILKNLGYKTPKVNFIWGNLYELKFSGKLPFMVQKEWCSKFGKVYGYYAGSLPVIIISDVRLLNDILVKEFNNFCDRPGMHNISRMLVNLRGQEWKDVRKTISGSLTSGKFKLMFSTISKCCDSFIEILGEKFDREESFDIFPCLSALTLDVMSKTALALDLDCQHNNENIILKNIREFFTSGSENVILPILCFPELSFLFLLPYLMSKQRRNQRFICSQVEKVIKARKTLGEADNYSDLLQLLMDAADETNSGKSRLTETEVIDNSFLFLLAGYETTSNALAYVFYNLAKYPEIQEKVYMEIRSLESAVTYDDLHKLVYTEQVLYEALRMYPPVISFVNRLTKDDIEINGWKFPRGMSVAIDVWNIHHDPTLWVDPEKFDPERFSPENKRLQDPMAFQAFGNGPRNCVGARFAVLESKMCIAKVIQHFEILPGDGFEEELSVVIRSIVLMNPTSVPVKLRKRSVAAKD